MKRHWAVVSHMITDLALQSLESLGGKIQQVPGSHFAVPENGTGGDEADRIRAAIGAKGWGSWYSLAAIHPNPGFTGGNYIAIRAYLVSGEPPDNDPLLNADAIVLNNTFPPLTEFMDRHPRAGTAFIAGYTLFRARRPIRGKADVDPPYLLSDSIRHSFFATGFRIHEADNPALRDLPSPRMTEGVAK